jgi:glutathione synthase/RimK-type ligase-like ATP-grasp enzyme
MIALWGIATDRPMTAVYKELRQRKHPVVLLDQLTPLPAAVDLRVDEYGIRGCWTDGRSTLDLSTVRALYARPYDTGMLLAALGLTEDAHVAVRLAESQAALGAWWSATGALVVNPPDAMSLNGSKPHQLAAVATAGFAVPQTLVTNNPEAALAFAHRYERVIYKSVSSVRSRVNILTPAHLTRLADLRWCPTQLQEWIPGQDMRVHVVGDDVFATAIQTSAVDYRYPGAEEEPHLSPACLPENVADRCRKMSASMGLLFAGIDLRRSPSGAWYCFEVNPSPGFTYYEAATGQPIAEAVARLLATA